MSYPTSEPNSASQSEAPRSEAPASESSGLADASPVADPSPISDAAPASDAALVSDDAPLVDEPPGPGPRRELLVALGAAIAVAALGFPLGWLWSSVAPWTPVLKTTGRSVLAQPEQEQMIADEGWYVFLTLGAGVLVAVLAWVLLRRYRGVPMMIALALGAAGGGVLTWWFGHSIGLDHFRYLDRNAAVGTAFTVPVDLRVKQVGLWHGWLPYARGDVLLFALATTVIYVLLAGFSAYPSLRGTRERVRSDG